MCKNAAATVANLMAGIEPTLVNLLTDLGIASTPDGEAAINAYNAALNAVQNWVPGTSAQDAIQVIAAFTAVFNTLPFPPEVKLLVDTISAGIQVVIGILKGNSPAPAPASAEDHQEAVAAETQAKVAALIPGFKEGWFTRVRAAAGDTHAVTNAYKSNWNQGVTKVSAVYPKYASLKMA